MLSHASLRAAWLLRATFQRNVEVVVLPLQANEIAVYFQWRRMRLPCHSALLTGAWVGRLR